jgi:hypothetical protein
MKNMNQAKKLNYHIPNRTTNIKCFLLKYKQFSFIVHKYNCVFPITINRIIESDIQSKETKEQTQAIKLHSV